MKIKTNKVFFESSESLRKKSDNNKKPLLLIVTGVACLVSFVVFVFSILGNKGSDDVQANQVYYSDQVILKINQEREVRGLDPLLVNEKLMLAAQNKANHMMEKNYFSHICTEDGKKWSDFIKEVDYDYLEAGENLANGYDSVDEMVEAWMNSPTHRENILGKGYFETGVGYAKGALNGRDTIFVVQVFGRTTEKRPDTISLYKENNDFEHFEAQEGSLMNLMESVE